MSNYSFFDFVAAKYVSDLGNEASDDLRKSIGEFVEYTKSILSKDKIRTYFIGASISNGRPVLHGTDGNLYHILEPTFGYDQYLTDKPTENVYTSKSIMITTGSMGFASDTSPPSCFHVTGVDEAKSIRQIDTDIING